MLSDPIGDLLRRARRQRNLSRAALAKRARVSVRLVAELERGQRPNVSLESALKLLRVVGVSVVATAPDGAAAEIRSVPAASDRLARAARRRQTWTGRHLSLQGEGKDPGPAKSKATRLASVAQVSRQAFAIAASPPARARVHPKPKSAR